MNTQIINNGEGLHILPSITVAINLAFRESFDSRKMLDATFIKVDEGKTEQYIFNHEDYGMFLDMELTDAVIRARFSSCGVNELYMINSSNTKSRMTMKIRYSRLGLEDSKVHVLRSDGAEGTFRFRDMPAETKSIIKLLNGRQSELASNFEN